MFAPTGLIINPNNPRPAQNDWGGAPYGPLHTPVVTCGSLLPRNRNYFNINLPNGAVPGVAVNLACHHVVGWDILWGFWNKLITLKHFKEARSFLGLFGAPQATTKDLEKIIQKKQFNTRGANWEAQMCWHPRNIVRGPNDRSDDPNQNNKLEDKIDFKLAKADIYEGRVSALRSAGQKMCDYIGNGALAKAADAIGYFRSIQNQEIMEWNEALWAVDKNFPSYSRTPSPRGGFDVVRPTWRVYAK